MNHLKSINPNLPLYSVSDPEFSRFGRVVTDFDFKAALIWLEERASLPDTGNIYVASAPELEAIAPKAAIEHAFFGQMPCQVGYCNGRNSRLNGLEYHKGSELLAAGTDLVLLLATLSQIHDQQIASAQVVGVYVSQGTAVELYATTLHFAPCRVSADGFRSLIILPQGTNEPLHGKPEGMLFARNKWLLIHPDAESQKAKGALVGITGPNIEVHY